MCVYSSPSRLKMQWGWAEVRSKLAPEQMTCARVKVSFWQPPFACWLPNSFLRHHQCVTTFPFWCCCLQHWGVMYQLAPQSSWIQTGGWSNNTRERGTWVAGSLCLQHGLRTGSAKLTASHWKSPHPKSLQKGRYFFLFPAGSEVHWDIKWFYILRPLYIDIYFSLSFRLLSIFSPDYELDYP